MPPLTDTDRRAYEANIWKSYAYQFLIAFQLWWPIWVIYLTDYRGFSLTQVSGLEGLFWLVIVLSEVPTGAVADRYGRKLSLILGGAFWGGSVLVFGVASSYLVVLLSYVAWGFGLTFTSGADAALRFESLKALGREHEYSRVAGISWGLGSLGAVAGMLIGAPIASATNLAVPILMSAGIGFLSMIVAFSFKEPNLDDGEVRLDYRKLIGESARTAWRSTAVRTMLFLAAVLLASANAVIVFSQPFLEQHDVSVGLFGIVQAPMRVGGIVGAIAAYRIGSLLGLRATLIASAVLLAGSYALLGGWSSVFAFGVTAVIFLLFNMLHPLIENYLNHRIPNAQRATILSFKQLLTSIVIASIQPVQGVIADYVSLEAMFWSTAAFVAATTPLFLLFWLRADGNEEASPLPDPELEATPAG